MSEIVLDWQKGERKRKEIFVLKYRKKRNFVKFARAKRQSKNSWGLNDFCRGRR